MQNGQQVPRLWSPEPRRPSNLQLTSVSSGLMGGTSATLSWSPPSSGAPASYLVLQDGQPVASRLGVISVVSAVGGAVPISQLGHQPHSVPASPSNGSASLSWNTPSGVPASSLTVENGALEYAVMMNGQQVGTAPATGSPTNTFAVKGVPAAGPAVFSVVPLTPSGPASSAASSPVPLAPYTGAGSPGAAHQRLVRPHGRHVGDLSWSPPAAGAPQSYQVLKDGVPVGSVSGSKTSTTVSDLPSGGVATLSVAP
eukprot:tig00021012_g16979.t1